MASQQSLDRQKIDGHVFSIMRSSVMTARGGHYKTWFRIDGKQVAKDDWTKARDEAMAREGRL